MHDRSRSSTFGPGRAFWAQFVDTGCVNAGAKRADGTWCFDKAQDNGWCKACWAEIVPVTRP